MTEAQETTESAVLDYEIVERNDLTLQVKFFNPYWVGKIEGQTVEEMGEEDAVEATKMVDTDPNKHVTKAVNIPLDPDGNVDRVALREVLQAQARGVLHRMDMERVKSVPQINHAELDELVGATEV